MSPMLSADFSLSLSLSLSLTHTHIAWALIDDMSPMLSAAFSQFQPTKAILPHEHSEPRSFAAAAQSGGDTVMRVPSCVGGEGRGRRGGKRGGVGWGGCAYVRYVRVCILMCVCVYLCVFVCVYLHVRIFDLAKLHDEQGRTGRAPRKVVIYYRRRRWHGRRVKRRHALEQF